MVDNKVNLFLENNKSLESVKGSWGMYGFQIKSNALISTMRNQKIDSDKINSALDLIKNNTSMFSNFRGLNKLTIAITISSENNMEESLIEIISIYNKLKEKFYSSEHLVIAAQVIFNARFRVNIDDAVKNTRTAYDYMKKHHAFLTGNEDIVNAAIIATTSTDLEATFNDIEEIYKYLKDNRISSGNNMQSLSHILSLINLPSKEKCTAVLEMKNILKEKKVPLNQYYTPLLGIISFLSDDKRGFADNIVDVSLNLKKEKGFGTFSLGSDFRNMLSAALVSIDYLDVLDSDIKENLINNTSNISLTIVLAIQTAIYVSSIAATSAAVASSSS